MKWTPGYLEEFWIEENELQVDAYKPPAIIRELSDEV